MENIIIIGHGSPKKDANNIETVGRLLHSAIHHNCANNCVKTAYLQFAEPGISSAIENCVADGARKIIIHPYFLSSGMHVSKDIPEMINNARNKYPDIEFVYAEPLGVHEKLIQVVSERIQAANGLRPEKIEERSFEIIEEETDLGGFPQEQIPIIKRVIHATADFEFKNTLVFHPDAIRTGIEAIREGKDILTDIEMVKTGVIKRWLDPFGGKVICKIQGLGIRDQGLEKENKTRAEAGIEIALKENNNIGIIAVGNAPTALLKVIDLFNQSLIPNPKPLVIGVPVGFVKALESKALLSAQEFPFITNLSRKGGTPVAVAIVNALLKMAGEEK